MRKLVLVSAFVGAFAFAPALSLADDIVIAPDIDAWVMEQPESGATFEGNVVVGEAVPDSVQIIEVPKNKKYGYVVLNKKRALVDMDSHKIIKIY